MFCSKCGTQNPDGGMFCAGCGAALTDNNAAQQAQQVQPAQPAQQAQPTQFDRQMTAQPFSAAVKPASNKKKNMIIIFSACGAVLAAFLIVLFTVIIPANTPRGKLRHIWQGTYGTGATMMLDLKNNTIADDKVYQITNWQVNGNLLTINCTYTTSSNQLKTENGSFIYSLSGDRLSLWYVEDYSPMETPDIIMFKAG